MDTFYCWRTTSNFLECMNVRMYEYRANYWGQPSKSLWNHLSYCPRKEMITISYQREIALCITNLKDPYDSVLINLIASPFNSLFYSVQTKWIWKTTGYYTNSTELKSYWKFFCQSNWTRIHSIQSFTFSFPMRNNNQK